MTKSLLKLNTSPGTLFGTLTLAVDFIRWRLNFLLPQEFLHYKNNFAPKILSSNIITCNLKSEFEVHILTCQRDFLEALWALKTFYIMSGLRPKLVIHDDGSLTPSAIFAFKTHFKNCTIITRAMADRLLKRKLKNYPYSFKYRFTNFRVHSMKLFDFYFASHANYILLLDSDVLFFKKPTRLIRNIKARQGFFMSDYRDAYAFPRHYLACLFGFKVRHKVNTGLVFLPKKHFDINLIEKFLKIAFTRMKHNHFPHKYWIEQTAMALIMSKTPKHFARLPSTYQISTQPLTRITASCHFVSDGSRHYFYTAGLKHLKTTGFVNLLLNKGR